MFLSRGLKQVEAGGPIFFCVLWFFVEVTVEKGIDSSLGTANLIHSTA